MKRVAQLLAEMKDAGIIRDFALFGAMAQMRYTEPVATMDADVLVLLPGEPGLDALSPIYRFCQSRGYTPEGEAIRVGDWPVQFMPVFNDLSKEAVEHAETGEVDGVPIRVASAAYLAVLALGVGRAKDHIRILSLIEAGAVTPGEIAALAGRHGLADRWETFRRRHLDVQD